MTYPAVPRIEWSLDGTRLLTCQGGTIRILDLDGDDRTLDGEGYVDARWVDDGGIAAIPWVEFNLHGEPRRAVPSGPRAYVHGTLSTRAAAWSVNRPEDWDPPAWRAGESGLVVRADGPPAIDWTLEPREYTLGPDPRRITMALPEGGTRVAVGYELPREADAPGHTRGWFVADTTAPRRRDRPRVPVTRGSWRHRPGPPPPLIHHVRYSLAGDAPALRFAFDRAGRRLAIAGADPEDDRGVIRVGRPERAPRMRGGGPRAVALDDRGLLVAYGYPSGTAERRLRVDYLAPSISGPTVVEIVDTLWLDPELDDITALAFDADSRLIACLGSDGGVEVVPVP